MRETNHCLCAHAIELLSRKHRRFAFLFSSVFFVFLGVRVGFYSHYSWRDRSRHGHITAKITRFLRLFLVGLLIFFSFCFFLDSSMSVIVERREEKNYFENERCLNTSERTVLRRKHDRLFFLLLHSTIHFCWCILWMLI